MYSYTFYVWGAEAPLASKVATLLVATQTRVLVEHNLSCAFIK
jgi:hypothetical protein